MKNEPLQLHLTDTQWALTDITHDREIVRAIVYDDNGYVYFMKVTRDDIFGKVNVIETAGGGVETSDASLQEAIKRELKEELGASVNVVCKLGVVSDYYNVIHRHNIQHYFLCYVQSFGQKYMTSYEMNDLQLTTVKLTLEEAIVYYNKYANTKLGRLIANREMPILNRAKEILSQINASF